MSCTPCTPPQDEFPIFCDPLATTANGKRLVVEDSAACQKTIQTPASGQVLTSNNETLGWTSGGNTTVLSKSSSGDLEFAKVQTDYIADNAITTAKIVDNAITTAKIVDNAITTAKIVDNAITTAKIVDNAITTAKIVDNAITTSKITNNSVTNEKLGQATGLSVIGTAGIPGNVDYIRAQTADSVLRRDGITLGFGQIKAGAIETGSITAPKLSGIQGGSAPIYGVRAWVSFNGTGTTGTSQFIEGSGNVSTVEKDGTGEYTIKFSTAMPNDNYLCIGSTGDTFGANSSVNFITKTTNTLNFKVYHSNNTLGDFFRIYVAVIG